jgi:AraC family transcriptional regulator
MFARGTSVPWWEYFCCSPFCANETSLARVQGFMNAAEQIFNRTSGACPVTDAAGSTIRRRDIAGFSLTEALYAEGVSLGRHCHANAYLTLVLSGTYTEKYMHREFVWGEGALHLLPAGERHENQFATAVRCLRVKIEPQAIERLGNEFERILSEPREISGTFSSWLANRMLREFRAQDDVAPLAMEGVLLEMLAESARSSEDGAGSSAPAWLRRVREALDESYLLAPSLADLAAVGRVHPVHLSREFRKRYRVTIGEYLRKRRIEHASGLLSKSGMPMAEIASTCGFSDQSHFCSLFKKYSGMTPAKFRDLSARPR